MAVSSRWVAYLEHTRTAGGVELQEPVQLEPPPPLPPPVNPKALGFPIFAERGGVLDTKSNSAKFTSRGVHLCGKVYPSDRVGQSVKCLRGSESCL